MRTLLFGLCALLPLTPAFGDKEQAEQAVERLIQASRDYDEPEMKSAAKALAKIGGPAVPFLIGAMKDHDDNVRWQAALALGDIGRPHAFAAIPSLMVASHDTDPDVRAAAVEGLILLKASGDQVKAELHKAAKDPNAMVRVHAHWALGRMGVDRPKQIERLVRQLGDEDWMAAEAASKFLVGLAKPSDLEAAITGTNSRMANGAALALGKMGTAARDVLARSLNKAPLPTMIALRAMGKDAGSFVEPLTKILIRSSHRAAGHHAERDGYFTAVIETLGSIGPEANSALPELRAFTQDENPDIRAAAAKAIGRIRVRSKEAAVLKALLTDPADHVRAAAQAALNHADETKTD